MAWALRRRRTLWVALHAAAVLLFMAHAARASSSGILHQNCSNCHSGGPAMAAHLTSSAGPWPDGNSVVQGGTRVTIIGITGLGSQVAAGASFHWSPNVGSASLYTANGNGARLAVRWDPGIGYYVGHNARKYDADDGSADGLVGWFWDWTAPKCYTGNVYFGSYQNAVNANGSNTGDTAAPKDMIITVTCHDSDGDGYTSSCCGGSDCNDDNYYINPGRAEVCNGVDDNCGGGADENLGSTTCGVGPCQRTVANCSGGFPQSCVPGSAGTETCNGVDDNCNGVVDDGLGAATCGIGACARSASACVNGVPQNCTPGQPAPETCANLNVDNDCDGDASELENGVHALDSCPTGKPGVCAQGGYACVNGAVSCKETTAASAERCNDADDDCNGSVDNGCDDDGDGYCDASLAKAANRMIAACPNTPAPLNKGDDCDDQNPISRPGSLEVCDGSDNDCDGVVDNGLPASSCGTGACLAMGTSCLPSSCTPGAPGTESCNGVDDDCNGKLDDGELCGSGMICAGGSCVEAPEAGPDAGAGGMAGASGAAGAGGSAGTAGAAGAAGVAGADAGLSNDASPEAGPAPLQGPFENGNGCGCRAPRRGPAPHGALVLLAAGWLYRRCRARSSFKRRARAAPATRFRS